MITLEVEPSLVHVLDSTVGLARVMAENRSGRDWAHVMLEGSDPERIVRVSLAASELCASRRDSANRRSPGSAAAEAGTEVSER